MKQRKENNKKTPGKRLGSYIIISIWMFVLGVFVGKGYIVQIDEKSPAKQAKGNDLIEKKSTKNFEQSGIIEEHKLGYYEDLRRDINISRFVEKNGSVPSWSQSDSNKTENKNKTYDTNKTVKTENKEKQKAEEQKEVFIVQAASFLNKQDAENFTALLKTKGYEAYISSATAKNKVWHRIRIGPVKNKSEAEEILKKLKKEHVEPMILTIKKDR